MVPLTTSLLGYIVYANALLATLNSRTSIRATDIKMTSESVNLSEINFQHSTCGNEVVRGTGSDKGIAVPHLLL